VDDFPTHHWLRVENRGHSTRRPALSFCFKKRVSLHTSLEAPGVDGPLLLHFLYTASSFSYNPPLRTIRTAGRPCSTLSAFFLFPPTHSPILYNGDIHGFHFSQAHCPHTSFMNYTAPSLIAILFPVLCAMCPSIPANTGLHSIPQFCCDRVLFIVLFFFFFKVLTSVHKNNNRC